MKHKIIYTLTTYLIAAVWLINGFVKMLNIVPRHKEIVERILGASYSTLLTVLIGFLEIIMALWVLINFKPKLNAITQIIIIATMNILEFILASDLLLWGKYNLLFAVLFIIFIFYREFVLNKKMTLWIF